MSDKHEKEKFQIGDKVKIKKGLVCEVVNIDGDMVCVDDREIGGPSDALIETKASTHREWHKASELTKEK